jgi:hypothetical protein
MVLGLPLNFSILPEELLISMVYVGVEVTACNGICDREAEMKLSCILKMQRKKEMKCM